MRLPPRPIQTVRSSSSNDLVLCHIVPHLLIDDGSIAQLETVDEPHSREVTPVEGFALQRAQGVDNDQFTVGDCVEPLEHFTNRSEATSRGSHLFRQVGELPTAGKRDGDILG